MSLEHEMLRDIELTDLIDKFTKVRADVDDDEIAYFAVRWKTRKLV